MIADRIIESLDQRDEAAFGEAMNDLRATVQSMSPAEVAAEAAALAAVVNRLPIGIGSSVAPALGAMCDLGARPGDVLDALVEGALRVLNNLEQFKQLCAQAGIETPNSGDDEAFPDTMSALIASEAVDMEPNRIAQYAEAWFAGNGWIQPVLYLCQREDVRAILPRREELTAAIESAREDLETAHWLYGLLLVLDDEQFVVLHRAGRKGWRCTMSGIGDNFQLHTLLAGHLAEATGVTAPTPVELAAADTGDLQPPDGIQGQYNLVGADGTWIWNEGRPADIPTLEGIRVVVLDPAPYARSWNAGRAYPKMPPTLTVDGELSAEEVDLWLGKVKPSER
ncbi:hypothetical protein KDL01_15830 [Actinospica durhamensis]|uniref:Uncharacterized protein n=1 Tax=Actinospica durhamensis TaxID=1508375 RepID=A0A941EP84_9ACTN|nr:hypothetical protein [Actinospica durhamensis]MBR7834745.1 hypothetical protein [Actinospica durhamensis]